MNTKNETDYQTVTTKRSIQTTDRSKPNENHNLNPSNHETDPIKSKGELNRTGEQAQSSQKRQLREDGANRNVAKNIVLDAGDSMSSATVVGCARPQRTESGTSWCRRRNALRHLLNVGLARVSRHFKDGKIKHATRWQKLACGENFFFP
ncbi:hypothetical protein AVEN_31017-1 [Araneus ventricosus]|uniref:Uncharacterized protein n=1 Tax=Araneus ventricosus TaxID=182803 RepID=A0A4Y2SWZ9_ARAVE|nr:hypothetical protein AVEN_31017-1 [Araneus ventricosus]